MQYVPHKEKFYIKFKHILDTCIYFDTAHLCEKGWLVNWNLMVQRHQIHQVLSTDYCICNCSVYVNQ